MAQVISVNVGRPREAAWAGIGRTCHRQAAGDRRRHGGPTRPRGRPGRRHQAPRRHRPGGLRLRPRGPRLVGGRARPRDPRRPVRARTSPPAVSTSTRPRWGSGGGSAPPCSRSSMVRIPCNDFKNWQRLNGYDDRAWVQAVHAAGARPGPYLRVVEEGELRAGDDLVVVHQPGHGVTVSTMFRALTTDRSLLPGAAARRRPGPRWPAGRSSRSSALAPVRSYSHVTR